MERYDFGKIVDRRGTGALKIDALQERYGNAGLLPLWVADMDFETPSFIIRALRQRLEHPLFGYTVEPEEYSHRMDRFTPRMEGGTGVAVIHPRNNERYWNGRQCNCEGG